jgi:hypothetical protein
MSPRVRGKATVHSEKVGGPTFVGPWLVMPEIITGQVMCTWRAKSFFLARQRTDQWRC